MKGAPKQPSVIAISILSLIFVISGLFIYRNILEDNLSNSSCDTLNDITNQQQFFFSQKLMEQQENIESYAKLLPKNISDENSTMSALADIKTHSTFNFIGIAKANGTGIENNGIGINVSNREYFLLALDGQPNISDLITSKITNKNIIVISSPIYTNSVISGVLLGVYNSDYLSRLLVPSFGGMGYTYITTDKGEIIVKTKSKNILSLNEDITNENILNELSQAEFYKYNNYDELCDNMSQQKSGHTKYNFKGENRLAHYAPIGINNWYIFTIIPENVISSQSQVIMQNTTVLTFVICFIFVMILFYFLKDHKNHIMKFERIAYVDTLTGINNKKKFKITASELLKSKSTHYAFISMDVDNFKVLNDTLGYDCGDKTLISIADIMKKSTYENESFGKADSDQYFMLLEYNDNKTVKKRVENIIASIILNFNSNINKHYNLVISAGIYIISDPTKSINIISDLAKHAHQLVKGNQSCTVAFYNENIHKQVLKEKEIENAMHDALTNEDFILFLQPKFLLNNEQIYGAEALVRWRTSDGTFIFPNDFIPIFEKNGFITELDMYMLKKSCAFIQNQFEIGITPVTISINFSRMHLNNADFVNQITSIVKSYNVPPQLIEIELTESTMQDNEDVLINVLEQLHKNGFTLSMDDFGSGYSSLGLLKNLSVDSVKLDRTFFTQYTNLARAKTVISCMISMTKQLNIYTVAEGVETQENIDLLKELSCDVVQGYYFAKPMTTSEFNALLKKSTYTNILNYPRQK